MDTELSRGSSGAAVTAASRCLECDCLFKWRASELVPETQIAHIEHLESLREEKVVLGSDGRHSTVRHSAKYCTYNLQDNASRKIVNMVQVYVSILLHSLCCYDGHLM